MWPLLATTFVGAFTVAFTALALASPPRSHAEAESSRASPANPLAAYTSYSASSGAHRPRSPSSPLEHGLFTFHATPPPPPPEAPTIRSHPDGAALRKMLASSSANSASATAVVHTPWSCIFTILYHRRSGAHVVVVVVVVVSGIVSGIIVVSASPRVAVVVFALTPRSVIALSLLGSPCASTSRASATASDSSDSVARERRLRFIAALRRVVGLVVARVVVVPAFIAPWRSPWTNES
jgi:hypothetical protein